jgi:superfamily I DNA/RNA helicase
MRIAIRAVAGAGKTSTMTLSIASAINFGIPMDQILSLTFARDAADNFADRLKGIGIQAGKGINGTDRVLTNTFHGMIKSLLESVIPLQLKGTKVNTELKMKQLYVSEDEPDPYFDQDGSGNFVKIDGLPADIANEGVYGTNLIERLGENAFRQVNDPQQDPVCVRIFEDLVHKENGRLGQRRDAKARIRILMSQIQMWKSAGLSSRNVLDILAEQSKQREIDETEAMAAKLYGPYQRQLQNHGIVEQGDHFIMMLNILNRYPELAEKWLHEKFKFILIDEAQDLNGVMLKILDHLVGPNTHVAFVGDPE